MSSNLFSRLKTKWGIESNWQVLAIVLVFTIAGPTVVYIRKWYFILLGFDDSTSPILKVVAYLFFIFPAYQVLLLFYGFLFGQFHFFLKKEKALIRLITGKKRQKE